MKKWSFHYRLVWGQKQPEPKMIHDIGGEKSKRTQELSFKGYNNLHALPH